MCAPILKGRLFRVFQYMLSSVRNSAPNFTGVGKEVSPDPSAHFEQQIGLFGQRTAELGSICGAEISIPGYSGQVRKSTLFGLCSTTPSTTYIITVTNVGACNHDTNGKW